MSEWQMPAYLISIRTSFGPTSRRWIVVFSKGALAPGVAYAVAVVVMPRACSLAEARGKPARLRGQVDEQDVALAALDDGHGHLPAALPLLGHGQGLAARVGVRPGRPDDGVTGRPV